MTNEYDRRTYDVLRLLDEHEPIGSVHLTEHLRERGYSLTERTVRLVLADLDESGLTEKAAGKGRRLTDAGRAELERGGVLGRVEQVRERLSSLTSQVTYDPGEDDGGLIVSTVRVPRSAGDRLDSIFDALDNSPIGPITRSISTAADDELLEVTVPSSVTIDGVLLSNGIESHPETIGVVEYVAQPEPNTLPYDDPDAEAVGGAIRRFTDVIGDERATLDLVELLIDAGRTDVGAALEGDIGLLVADNREVPLNRFETIERLATGVRNDLGGVVDLRRPREPGPVPWGDLGWSSVSVTYVGPAELVISRCVEVGIAEEWDTLAGLRDRSALDAQ